MNLVGISVNWCLTRANGLSDHKRGNSGTWCRFCDRCKQILVQRNMHPSGRVGINFFAKKKLSELASVMEREKGEMLQSCALLLPSTLYQCFVTGRQVWGKVRLLHSNLPLINKSISASSNYLIPFISQIQDRHQWIHRGMPWTVWWTADEVIYPLKANL